MISMMFCNKLYNRCNQNINKSKFYQKKHLQFLAVYSRHHNTKSKNLLQIQYQTCQWILMSTTTPRISVLLILDSKVSYKKITNNPMINESFFASPELSAQQRRKKVPSARNPIFQLLSPRTNMRQTKPNQKWLCLFTNICIKFPGSLIQNFQAV